MKKLALLLTAAVLAPAMAQGADTPYLEAVRARAADLRAGDAPPAALEDWTRQREALRAALEAAWGGFPADHAPLSARVLEALPRDGYRVEKIVFQTLPEVWMTANAYVPEAPGPHPAVLSVHGHWPGAKQDPHVQARCIGLAKLGYFVLAVDALGAGERGIGTALGEYHGDMTAGTLWPVGRPLSGLQVYENGRAVDYLLTRPEVDGARIGITGASGGGNQSMYAGAWDDRFKAVVPVCSVGNYQSYLGAACCMCEVVPGILRHAEEWGVLALAAPRALLVINATMDARQFSVEEARKSLALAAPVFTLQGAPGNLRHDTFESGHDYNQPMREAMYGWMALHLKGEGDGSPVPEPAMELEDPETLRCFPGETRPADWMTIPRIAAREGRMLVDRLRAPETAAAWQSMADGMRERLDRDVLGGTDPEAPRGIDPGSPVLPEGAVAGAGSALLLQLDETPGPAESVVVAALESAGRAVIPIHLRAAGVHAQPNDAIGRAPDHNTAEWALWLGEPLLGQWVRDVRTAIDTLEAAGAPLDTMALVGAGPAGVVALCAAALDARIAKVAAVGSLASYITEAPYEGQRLGILAPGILRDAGDIAHIAALIAPRRLVMAGPVTGSGEPLAADTIGTVFAFTRDVYGLAGAEDAFRLAVDMTGEEILRGLE
ncbi:MAG: acetylxylan esterase [Candidatus Hydrogenedentes bacterium]|nr:acetylxylan esterase [Candidatus Hydrogenedentota bacterium]